jgi:tRNA (guanine-N7-)-methyltransferase
VWLEIGFGGGEHLLTQARANPQVGLIGCEPFQDGVIKVLSAIESEGLANIRLVADDARPVLRWLPDANIARAFILFPDPWPKKRHHKRRLIAEPTLGQIARVLRKGAELRLATDVAAYAGVMLLEMQRKGAFRWRAAGPRDWRQRPADWPATRYEAKAQAAGRRCAFLIFERV